MRRDLRDAVRSGGFGSCVDAQASSFPGPAANRAFCCRVDSLFYGLPLRAGNSTDCEADGTARPAPLLRARLEDDRLMMLVALKARRFGVVGDAEADVVFAVCGWRTVS